MTFSFVGATQELPASPLPALSAKKMLEQSLKEVPEGESLWILVPMEDSFENEIMVKMREQPEWESQLSLYQALSFEGVRELVKRAGFSISHSEVRRGITVLKDESACREWIEKELSSQLDLDGDEKIHFTEVIVEIMRGKVYFPYKQLLMCISRE